MESPLSNLKCPDCSFCLDASQNRVKEPEGQRYLALSMSNAYPGVQEETNIKAEVNSAAAQLLLVTSLIARFKAAAEVLESESLRISNIITKYKDVLRPVHKLPVELLSRIFSFSVEPTLLYSPGPGLKGVQLHCPSSLNPSRMPWVLAQVCRSWREIALSTSSLWSVVSLEISGNALSGPSALYQQAQRHLLLLQLMRCGEHPLTVITTNATTQFPDTSNAFLLLLSTQTRRWKHLRIQIAADTQTMPMIKGLLPLLESLDIAFLNSQPVVPVDCFEFAPKLNTLVLTTDALALSTKSMPQLLRLPWHQITNFSWLNGEDIEPNSFRLVHNLLVAHLKHTLVSFRVCLSRKTLRAYKEVKRTALAENLLFIIPFVHLHTVELLCPNHTFTGAAELLPWISATHLTSLTISCSGHQSSPLIDFLSVSKKLTTLTIYRVEMSVEDLSAVLAQLTVLTSLGFGVLDGILDEHIALFQAITYTGGFAHAPNLTNLSLFASHSLSLQADYSDDALVDMLEARRRIQNSGPHSSHTPPKPRLLSVNLGERVIENLKLDILRVEGLDVIMGSPL